MQDFRFSSNTLDSDIWASQISYIDAGNIVDIFVITLKDDTFKAIPPTDVQFLMSIYRYYIRKYIKKADIIDVEFTKKAENLFDKNFWDRSGYECF